MDPGDRASGRGRWPSWEHWAELGRPYVLGELVGLFQGTDTETDTVQALVSGQVGSRFGEGFMIPSG